MKECASVHDPFVVLTLLVREAAKNWTVRTIPVT